MPSARELIVMPIKNFHFLRRAAGIPAATALASVVALVGYASPSNSQPNPPASRQVVSSYQSNSSEQDRAHSYATHRYTGPYAEADRAKDALLILEVKAALAGNGVTSDHAVVVDCDHGTVLLTGAVGSAGDARHAVAVASSIKGVAEVKNRLKW
jgi:osmotically-inducible protein OsmY